MSIDEDIFDIEAFARDLAKGSIAADSKRSLTSVDIAWEHDPEYRKHWVRAARTAIELMKEHAIQQSSRILEKQDAISKKLDLLVVSVSNPGSRGGGLPFKVAALSLLDGKKVRRLTWAPSRPDWGDKTNSTFFNKEILEEIVNDDWYVTED